LRIIDSVAGICGVIEAKSDCDIIGVSLGISIAGENVIRFDSVAGICGVIEAKSDRETTAVSVAIPTEGDMLITIDIVGGIMESRVGRCESTPVGDNEELTSRDAL
jgi:hypothetical protein